MTRALVLSGGGMFGAYQAGAWKVLAETFQPDLIVGVSAGALNGWALAGGCSPSELCASWTDPSADLMHARIPFLPWRGIFDSVPLYQRVDDYFARFHPRLPFAVTLVDALRMREVFITGDKVTPAHLRATCAIPFGYPPVRIEGRYYLDGGLLTTVPLWAAVEMGATSAIVINVLPYMPSRFLRATVGAFRALVAPPAIFPGVEVIKIFPARPLGTVREAVSWKEENARKWIAQGERDAMAALTQLPQAHSPTTQEL
jgi:NTE family protein